MTRTLSYVLLISGLFALVMLSACEARAQDEVSVEVSDQQVQNDQVTVDEVEAEVEGFVVLHRTNAAGDGPLVPSSVGHAQVSEGLNTDVAVTLDESVGEGDKLWAMLHVDSNGNGIYEFGPGSTDVDTPVTRDDRPVMESFTVEGPATALAEGLISRKSSGSVAETESRLVAALNANDFIVVAQVDHAANASGAGLELPPTRLVIFGKPAVGTQLMQGERTVGIDLPQKMLVWEDGGEVLIAYNSPYYLAERHGVEDQNETLDTVANALASLAKAAATPQ